MKNPVSGLAAAAFLTIALLAGAAAPADAKVLARVNGVEITEDDLKIALEDIGQGLRPRSMARSAMPICSIISST